MLMLDSFKRPIQLNVIVRNTFSEVKFRNLHLTLVFAMIAFLQKVRSQLPKDLAALKMNND